MPKSTLADELRKLVETRLEHTLAGIEDTLQRVTSNNKTTLQDLRQDIRSLEESFSLLSQKWSLEILYMLFLRSTTSFSDLKRILGVNSRTLSDKLKSLKQHEYIQRTVKTGPPLRVEYSLTLRGRNTALLALPLLYYSSSSASHEDS